MASSSTTAPQYVVEAEDYTPPLGEPTTGQPGDVTEDSDSEVPHIDTWRQKAKCKYHLLDHSEYNPRCPGCNAKARDKRHFRKSVQRDHPKHINEITMDQVGLTDVEGTLGIGKYKYAIVICKISEDYWTFAPLKSLEAHEADIAFRQFCAGIFPDIKAALVYCDSHRSLIKIWHYHH